ncbi:hypothetical protein CYMTET_7325 [Cymbomonas tetramitiformis]|uniref:Uncharacterized protein n=1 Tax=Cymbomonas tetramitiformis TaxID=36881 RepID=A0AAE0LHK4_9CHLO|nr:hypothetical protein CYMTET_7325 [Cymbomonas tetramitiformis]
MLENQDKEPASAQEVEQGVYKRAYGDASAHGGPEERVICQASFYAVEGAVLLRAGGEAQLGAKVKVARPRVWYEHTVDHLASELSMVQLPRHFAQCSFGRPGTGTSPIEESVRMDGADVIVALTREKGRLRKQQMSIPWRAEVRLRELLGLWVRCRNVAWQRTAPGWTQQSVYWTSPGEIRLLGSDDTDLGAARGSGGYWNLQCLLISLM